MQWHILRGRGAVAPGAPLEAIIYPLDIACMELVVPALLPCPFPPILKPKCAIAPMSWFHEYYNEIAIFEG